MSVHRHGLTNVSLATRSTQRMVRNESVAPLEQSSRGASLSVAKLSQEDRDIVSKRIRNIEKFYDVQPTLNLESVELS
jgi:hypothetical protein